MKIPRWLLYAGTILSGGVRWVGMPEWLATGIFCIQVTFFTLLIISITKEG